MNINIIEEGNTITAVFDGRLDTVAAQQIAETINPLLQHSDRNIILDCEKLDYISSSGLRLFLTLLKVAKSKGSKVCVASMNDNLRQVFAMTGFTHLFEFV